MTTCTFQLGKVSEAGLRAIADGLRIDGENVRTVDLDAASGTLTVELAHPEAEEHVSAFVSSMRRTHRLISRKVHAETHASSLALRNVDAGLVSSPFLHILGDGLVGMSGDLLRLFRFFEGTFRRLAAGYDAEEQHYPVLVPSELLAEVGYFGHFPQHITFCSHLPGDLPVLERVADTEAGKVPDELPLAPPRHVLTPAVCLPCYRQLRGAVIDGTRTLTMQNHVFRYEGTNFQPLRRGWDFTVRDVVFFGRFEELSRLRAEVMDRAIALCRELDLEATIELANDPFFLDASRDKAVYQRMGEVKFELLFPMPDGRAPLAASSFNLHRDYYTSVYGIRRADGEPAESACMGFGIDRWVYALLTQKGLDPAGWPAQTRLPG